MKYVVLLCDGMADTPCPELEGRTPMEAARKPHMDALAARAEVGTVRTVPEGLAPGSDVANLAVMGYDTRTCYTGRSPLEAANIGVELADDDVAFRCNLVTLSDDPVYTDKTILDYCAGDIHTADADPIIRTIQAELGGGTFDFYTGTAYRHCMVWHGGKTALGAITPPHDITGKPIAPYLPAHPDAAPVLELMRRSAELLKEHPVNRERIRQGQRHLALGAGQAAAAAVLCRPLRSERFGGIGSGSAKGDWPPGRHERLRGGGRHRIHRHQLYR